MAKDSDSKTPPAEGARSTLITFIAWIMIVIAGLCTLGAAWTNATLIASGQWRDMGETSPLEVLGETVYIEDFPIAVLMYAVISAVAMILAVGVLRRKRWAWAVSIIGLVLGILCLLPALTDALISIARTEEHFTSRGLRRLLPEIIYVAVLSLFAAGFPLLLWVLTRSRYRREFSRPAGGGVNERQSDE